MASTCYRGFLKACKVRPTLLEHLLRHDETPEELSDAWWDHALDPGGATSSRSSRSLLKPPGAVARHRPRGPGLRRVHHPPRRLGLGPHPGRGAEGWRRVWQDPSGHSVLWNAIAFERPDVALLLLRCFPPDMPGAKSHTGGLEPRGSTGWRWGSCTSATATPCCIW